MRYCYCYYCKCTRTDRCDTVNGYTECRDTLARRYNAERRAPPPFAWKRHPVDRGEDGVDERGAPDEPGQLPAEYSGIYDPSGRKRNRGRPLPLPPPRRQRRRPGYLTPSPSTATHGYGSIGTAARVFGARPWGVPVAGYEP